LHVDEICVEACTVTAFSEVTVEQGRGAVSRDSQPQMPSL